MKTTLYAIIGLALLGFWGLPLGMAGAFSPVLTFALAAGSLLAVHRYTAGLSIGVHDRTLAEERWSAQAIVAAVVGVAIAVSHVRMSGEDIFMRRDPSAYLNLAQFLRRSGSLRDKIDPFDFRGIESPRLRTPGTYDMPGGIVEVQFSNGLSVVLAVAGSLGDSAMFALTAIVATLAAAVFAALAVVLGVQRFVAVSLFVMLTASVPFIYVARSTYSEPYQAAVLAAGLLITVAAMRSGSFKLLVVASFLIGSNQMFRVDGLLYVGVFLIGLSVAASISDTWRCSLRQRLGIAASLAAPLTVGVTDLLGFTGNYAADLSGRWQALVGLVVSTALLFLIDPFQKRGIRQQFHRFRVDFVAQILASALALVWAILLLIYGVGDLASVGVWFGVGLIVAAAVGLQTLLFTAMHRGAAPEAFIAVFVALAIPLYIVRPSIWSDQPWASRRLMGFAAFGLFLLAAIGINCLANTKWSRVSVAASSFAAVVLGTTMLIQILAPLPNAFKHSPRAGERAVVMAVCDALREADKVIVSGPTSTGFPLRAFCGQPTIYVDLTSESVQGLVESSRKNGERIGFAAPFAQAIILEEFLSEKSPAARIRGSVGPQIAPFDDTIEKRRLIRFRLQMQTESHDLIVVLDS